MTTFRPTRYWKLINETFDVYGMQVTVVQTTQMRQFAFVYECISEGRPCSGETAAALLDRCRPPR